VRILLTNDDGISSDGLWAAARGLARISHLTVIGTLDDWSGGSASIRLSYGARLARYPAVPPDLASMVEAYSLEAAPGGAILTGLMTGLFEPFDLIASGANYGINVGADLVHSGTLGAAVTGYQRGLTAFAISADRGAPRGEPQRWDVIADVSERVGSWLLRRQGPPLLLNVNVPNRPFNELRGAKIVKPVTWGNLDRARLDAVAEGEDAWRITASIIRDVPYPDDEETDSGAVMAGYIALSQVAPTGWVPEPLPDDLHQLVETLTPGSQPGSTIQAPVGAEGGR
jgi:5'-nucleotidase